MSHGLDSPMMHDIYTGRSDEVLSCSVYEGSQL